MRVLGITAAVGGPSIDGRGDGPSNVRWAHLVLKPVWVALRKIFVVADSECHIKGQRGQGGKHVVRSDLQGG